MTIEQSESNYKYMIHLTILGFLNGPMDVPITFNTMCYNWVSEILKEFGWEEDPDNVFELNGWAADFYIKYNKGDKKIAVSGDCFDSNSITIKNI